MENKNSKGKKLINKIHTRGIIMCPLSIIWLMIILMLTVFEIRL